MTEPQPQSTWNQGPAKAAIVALLGIVAAVGIGRAILSGSARPVAPLEIGQTNVETLETPATSASAPQRAELLIDVNTAGALRLSLLPGIGEALAARIIESRETEGPFRSLNDLDRVRGIGPRTIENLRGKAMASPTPEISPAD